MTVAYLGSLTLGAAVPSLPLAIGASLPTVQGQIAGLLAAQLQLNASPPSLAGFIADLNALLANLTNMLALGIPIPTLSVQLAAVAAALVSLQAQASLLLGYQSALGAAGVFAYAYTGQASALGAGFSTELASGFPGGSSADATNALLLATTTPAAWAAIQSIMRTS